MSRERLRRANLPPVQEVHELRIVFLCLVSEKMNRFFTLFCCPVSPDLRLFVFFFPLFVILGPSILITSSQHRNGT